MSKFETIFFDLDGTLCDSLEGINNGLVKALILCGVSNIDRILVQKMIGIPLPVSLKKYFFPNDKSKVDKAILEYKKYYCEVGIYESKLYPGINDLLIKLSINCRLIIITAKPTELAKKVLSFHNVDTYFDEIKGLEPNEKNFSKSKMILESLKTPNSIMIGDKGADVLAGKKCGIQTAGVVFGYGTFKEVKKSNPDYILRTTEDLEKILN